MKQINYFHGIHEQPQRSKKDNNLSKGNCVTPKASKPAFKPRMTDEAIELYHSVSYLLPDTAQSHVIEFLGSRDEEGTSTISSEFAWALHEKFNKSVLILDADSLKLSQHAFFNIKPGLSWDDIFRSGSPLEAAIYPVAGPGLFISHISQSDIISVVSRTLISQSIEYLKDKFDFIIIDSPPAHDSSFGIDICRAVDGIVLVVEADATRLPVVQAIKQKIQREGGNILGMAFNKRRHYIPKFIYSLL